jgi:hypothetical protein
LQITKGDITLGTNKIHLDNGGSGYLAGGNISWSEDGSGSLAGGNITWDIDGNVDIHGTLHGEDIVVGTV